MCHFPLPLCLVCQGPSRTIIRHRRKGGLLSAGARKSPQSPQMEVQVSVPVAQPGKDAIVSTLVSFSCRIWRISVAWGSHSKVTPRLPGEQPYLTDTSVTF